MLPARPGNFPLGFRLDAVQDLDGDNRPEIIGGWNESAVGLTGVWRPVVIGWDDAARRYRITPLLKTRPKLMPAKGRQAPKEQYHYLYTHRRSLRDGTVKFFSYGAQDYAVLRSGRQAVLVIGYVNRTVEFRPTVYELKTGPLFAQVDPFRRLAFRPTEDFLVTLPARLRLLPGPVSQDGLPKFFVQATRQHLERLAGEIAAP